MTAIEINGTFYRTQKPATFAKWRDETPDDFVFAVKAPRYATIREMLAEAGTVDRALRRERARGARPEARSAPVAVRADEALRRGRRRSVSEAAAAEIGGRPARHVLEPRHESFLTREFVALARRYRCGDRLHRLRRISRDRRCHRDFVYARLMRCAGVDRDRLRAVGARRVGEDRAHVRARRASRRIPARRRSRRRNRNRATSSCSSSTARKNARRRPRRRCCQRLADQTATARGVRAAIAAAPREARARLTRRDGLPASGWRRAPTDRDVRRRSRRPGPRSCPAGDRGWTRRGGRRRPWNTGEPS